MGSTLPHPPAKTQQLSIRAGNLNEVFSLADGNLVRGVMIAYNQRGEEVARGATYQQFMESLKRNQK